MQGSKIARVPSANRHSWDEGDTQTDLQHIDDLVLDSQETDRTAFAKTGRPERVDCTQDLSIESYPTSPISSLWKSPEIRLKTCE